MREKKSLPFRRRKKRISAILLLTVALFFLLGTPVSPVVTTNKATNLVTPSYAASPDDLRGVWVATVFDLDYPTSPSTNKNILKSQLDTIVENVKSAGFNTIFFQVRPAADSFYPSNIFPWSKYLTGKQGTAPSENFDPLKYLIETAHEKGLQLHAWINPYRITTGGDKDYEALTANHPAKQNPNYVIKYTDGNYYFDPGIPEVRDLVADGITEIIENYDVDGIHLDDYFYPGSNFPDQATFEQYGANFTDIEDWRRNNVDTLVKQLYERIHKKNPKLIFGISPTGVWANRSSLAKRSNTRGQESYFDMYADTRKWVKNHWIDYIAPQIYWEIGHKTTDYQVLVDWWSDTVKGTGVKLYIGIAGYKAGNQNSESPWNGTTEILKQLKLNDEKAQVSGEILFRYGSLINVDGLKNTISAYYNGTSNETETGNPTLSGENQPAIRFTDLDQTEWAKPYIYKLAEQGIVVGKGGGKFDPMAQVTRAEYITMLINAMEFEKTDSQICNFSDVAAEQWYYTYLAAAQFYGIIPTEEADANKSTSFKAFHPNTPISREDMALFTQNALIARTLSPENPKKLSFKDNASISSEEKKKAVAALSTIGIIHGYEDHTFRPQGLTTRAESSTVICSLLNYCEDAPLS